MKYLGVALISLAITLWGLIASNKSFEGKGAGNVIATGMIMFIILFVLLSLCVFGVTMIIRG